MKKKLFIKTHGCQMNEYDSAKMMDLLQEKEDFELAESEEEADLLILNTCSIREKAQEKVFHQIGRWRKIKDDKPDLKIAIGGCVASQEGKEIINNNKPHVVMVVGVNGVGKTTTIGKLAYQFKSQGKKIILGAADTFRAGAIDQLQIWSDRAGVQLIRQEMGSDPASVAFDTLQAATSQGADIVFIDTAGRLHNKINLMNELSKVKRVMAKVIPDAPHEVMLVLDGSTGQNAFEQAKQFTSATDVTSLAITKLDGTAKGGVLLGISDQFQIPVKYIGVGEGLGDLQDFNPQLFAQILFS